METQEGDRKNAILRGFEKRILFQRPLLRSQPLTRKIHQSAFNAPLSAKGWYLKNQPFANVLPTFDIPKRGVQYIYLPADASGPGYIFRSGRKFG